MRLSDAVLFYTDREIDEYRSTLRRDDTRPIGALNNGLNVEPIRAVRTVYDARGRDNAVLFIGRITEKANLGLLLKALTYPELADVTLHVVGSGPEEGNARDEASALAINDRVVWHGGTTDEVCISRVANRCRVMVYPGEVGLSLIHGMAYGLPAIIHSDRWKHMPEVAAFRDGFNGASFEKEDHASLARVIREALENPDTLNAWSRNCVQTTEEDFNTASMARRFQDLITELELHHAR